MYVPKKLKLPCLSFVPLALGFFSTAMADDFNKTFEKAVKFGQEDGKYGQVKFDLRFRYENADSVNPSRKTASAFTGRLRLGYLSPVFENLQGYAEFETNQDILASTYNSGRNGKTKYETISDPQQKELNQLWLSYKGFPDTEIKIGRQRIQFDNERFIGAAAWRQLERTFDGLHITNTSIPNTTIKLGYLLKQQNTDSTVHQMQLPVVNIAYNFEEFGTLSSYGYWLDDRDQRQQDSNQTYGVRLDGSYKVSDDLRLHYNAEYAFQRNYAGNPTIYKVDYYHFVGGLSTFGITVKAGMEELDGKGLNKTFDTPFGLLHKFDGWADLFLTTPDKGLRDVYASVETDLEGFKLSGIYHDFTDDTTKQHYGDEWDFQITRQFFKHYNFLAKYAYFSAENNGMKIVNSATPISLYDTQKFWFAVSITF